MCEADSSSTSSDSDTESSTTATIMQERRVQHVLAVPAVRRIAMEYKVPALFTVFTLRAAVPLYLGLQWHFVHRARQLLTAESVQHCAAHFQQITLCSC